ncbi:MAG: hypothetical protein IKR40_01465 [Treponema sp.]|nr:hypothetical protein [Treponema sp.]
MPAVLDESKTLPPSLLPPAILAKLSDALEVSVSDLFKSKEAARSANFDFTINAIKSILTAQTKSFETFCENYFEKG